jgi:hypothetical protein
MSLPLGIGRPGAKASRHCAQPARGLRASAAGLAIAAMTLFLRVHPCGKQYRLPAEEEAGEVTKSLAEVLGNRGCVVLGYELADQPRNTAVVLINGNVVECVELVDVPEERREQ